MPERRTAAGAAVPFAPPCRPPSQKRHSRAPMVSGPPPHRGYAYINQDTTKQSKPNMKPSTIHRLAPAVLWLALTPCNAPAQGEPPPAAKSPVPYPSGAVPAAPANATPIPAPVPAKPPRFHSSGTELLPDTVLDIDFPASVIPADQVNSETPADLIKTDPAIPGKGIWTSRTTARFTFTEPPPLGTVVKFSIAPGHRYEDGAGIPSGQIGTKTTPSFKLESWPGLGHGEREPVMMFVFNDAVTAATAGPFLTFSDGAAGRVPVKTGPLYYKDAPSALSSTWAARWNRQAGEKPAALKPDDIVPNVLIVRPLMPLPTGEHWRVEVMAGLPNGAGTATIPARLEAGYIRVAPLTVGNLRHTGTGADRVALHVSFSQAVPQE